jgi:hypothetical protein
MTQQNVDCVRHRQRSDLIQSPLEITLPFCSIFAARLVYPDQIESFTGYSDSCTRLTQDAMPCMVNKAVMGSSIAPSSSWFPKHPKTP